VRNGDDQAVHDDQPFHAFMGETFEEPAADVSPGSSQLMLRKNTHDPGIEVVESQVITARLGGPGREPGEVYLDAYDAAASRFPVNRQLPRPCLS